MDDSALSAHTLIHTIFSNERSSYVRKRSRRRPGGPSQDDSALLAVATIHTKQIHTQHDTVVREDEVGPLLQSYLIRFDKNPISSYI